MNKLIKQCGLRYKFKKYKNIFFEFIINILSFSLIIVAQQFFVFPYISRFLDVGEFGKIVIAFGISNIITSMFGFSIGNARLLNQKFYNTTYLKMFNISNIMVVVISYTIFNFVFLGSYIESFIYSIICVLGNIRYFVISEFRIRDEHNCILKQNIGYFLGMLIGSIFFYFERNWLIVFLLAEIISFCYSYYYFQKSKFFKMFKDNSDLKYNNTIHLIINNGASYSLLYYDRFVIYPILGATNVSLYYSAAVSSKIGGLVINPLSNFILGKLASNKHENANSRVLNLVVLGSLCVTVLYFLLSIVTTPILVLILYPNFILEIKEVFIPICLGAAIMGGVNILKPVIMKNLGAKYYNRLFLMYGIVLLTLSIILCIKYELIGLAIANTISSTLLFIWLIIVLRKYRKRVQS